ncbi:hypothetical protein D3C78_1170080 [compost metagenome]
MLSQIVEYLRTHNVRGNLELKYAAAVVLDQKTEHFERIIPFDIKRSIHELDQLCA